MEYEINSKEMLCRLYAIMCVADDEYSRPEHEILEIIMKDYGLNYEKVNELYNDLRHDYSHDYDRALDETLNSITDNDMRKEAISNLKKLSQSDGVLHTSETYLMNVIEKKWNIEI